MKPIDPSNRSDSTAKNIRGFTAPVLKALQDYLSRQDDIVAVYLFGSFGTEFQNKFSDLDLGVVFYPGKLPDLGRELSIEAELSLILGIDRIDLINLNRAPVQLRFKAAAKGSILFEANANELSSFLENTYRIYGDYQIDLETYYREYQKALREAYLNG
ncbi:MAG: type VII toxin-antitoxin system MntA family adenylyltransferase antitoxin [Bacillota bacterium]